MVHLGVQGLAAGATDLAACATDRTSLLPTNVSCSGTGKPQSLVSKKIHMKAGFWGGPGDHTMLYDHITISGHELM